MVGGFRPQRIMVVGKGGVLVEFFIENEESIGEEPEDSSQNQADHSARYEVSRERLEAQNIPGDRLTDECDHQTDRAHSQE